MEKSCVRCGELKHADAFHKRAKAADGLNPACKDCICAARRDYRAANLEREREAARMWRLANPGRQAELSRAWRAKNPDRHREYAAQWAADNAERRAVTKHAWYLANREHVLGWSARNPEAARAKWQRYQESHRDARAESQRRRRVDKLGGVIEDVDLDALWTGACGICSLPLDRGLRWPHPQSKSIDHIVPLALGGTHQAVNLQWAHLRCNVSKGARMPEGGELSSPRDANA